MKKLLKVSLVAILAVGPVAAFAATAPITYAGGATQGANGPTAVTASPVLATKSYVQGAYNELAEGINAEHNYIGALPANAQASTIVGYIDEAVTNAGGQTQEQVKGLIDSAAGNGLSGSNGVLTVDLQENSGLAVDSTGVALSDATKTSLGKADTALQSGNIGSGLAWDATNGVTLSAANQAKIDSAITKDVNDLTNYTTTTDMNTALGGKQNTIDSEHKLSGSLIADSSISATQLDTALNSAIAKANSALQSAALEGLASEAFVTSTAATTLQSAKAYVDERGVVAANTWGADTTVLVNLSTSASN